MIIEMTAGRRRFEIKLDNTLSSRKLFDALPIESRIQTWGKEIYFEVPVRCEPEADAVDVVDPGIVCFWVEGNSVAIPFGPTPASTGGECRLVAPVNILGKIMGDLSGLHELKDSDSVRLEKKVPRESA